MIWTLHVTFRKTVLSALPVLTPTARAPITPREALMSVIFAFMGPPLISMMPSRSRLPPKHALSSTGGTPVNQVRRG